MAPLSVSDEGRIYGYGSVFGALDSHRDIVERGAYRNTLEQWQKRGRLPALLLMHAMGPLTTDQCPIGLWTRMVEDDRGLWCEGQLALGNSIANDVYALLRMSPPAIEGLSIGYIPVKWTQMSRNSDVKRRLTEIRLLEVSVVTTPSCPEAVISRVKSREDAGDRFVHALKALLH